MTHDPIRQTHIYLPEGRPGVACPVAFPQRHTLCKTIGVDLRQPFARPLSHRHVNAVGIDKLSHHYLAGTDHADDHLLYLVVEGACWGISQDFQQPITPGDLFVAAAGHGAWIQLTEGSCTAVWFHLAATELWQAVTRNPVNVHRASNPDGIGTIMELLLREQSATHADNDSVARHYCAVLATYLAREIEDLGSPTERLARQRLHRLRELLNNRLDEHWTVERMAAAINVSAGHLHLLSKQYNSETPMDTLRQLRMERARALLQSTTQTLDNIAAQIGYRTPYAFSDAFRRYTGQRPGAYRTSPDTSAPHERPPRGRLAGERD